MKGRVKLTPLPPKEKLPSKSPALLGLIELLVLSEAATRGVLWEKVVLKISQNSQENTCARIFIKNL